MTLFAGPIDLNDPLVDELLKLIKAGLPETDGLRKFLDVNGFDRDEIDLDGPPLTARRNTIEVLGRCGELRAFVAAMRADVNFAAVAQRIADLVVAADVRGGTDGTLTPQEHIRVAMVGVRPFVNRKDLRDNLETMFVESGSRVMVVDGPRYSGRSYTWFLVQYVARQVGRQAKLLDLTTFRDTQATPADVARMLAVRLGWDKPEEDVTSQDYTKGRLVLQWAVGQVEKHGPVCLVIDGLDGANLAEATVTFVGDLATAAVNDELGDSTIVLLAFGRPFTDPGVEPFVLREPATATLAGSEITGYLKTASVKSAPLDDDQACQLAEKLFGTPLPQSLPYLALRDKAGELSKAVRTLLKGGGGG